MPFNIRHTGIVVSDLEKSKNFYCNLLGFKVKKEMDEHGWVVGFGDLKKLEKYLLEMYDHTMIIAKDDPELGTFQELHEKGLCDLRIVPEASLESSAKSALNKANEILAEMTNGRANCFKVEARENDKNSATYQI